MIIRFDENLEWRKIEMPCSSGPVELSLLHKASDGAISALVRFPVGWSRQIAGYYEVEEEFVVLDGRIDLDGLAFIPHDWALVPLGEVRHSTSTSTGALAWARFGGPAIFKRVTQENPHCDVATILHQSLLSVAKGGRELLATHPDQSTSSKILGHSGSFTNACELLSLSNRWWSFTEPGSLVPDVNGITLLREYPSKP